ncbi:MAG: type IV pilus assembly protein PilQ [Candidatus Omnitrophota bacterium]
MGVHPLNSNKKINHRSSHILLIGFASLLTIFCASNALAEAPAITQVPSANSLAKNSLQQSLHKKISLDLRDMDIVDVLKFLSLKGDFNLAMDNRIAGRVTLVMKDVTIADALDVVLKTNHLAYHSVGDIVYVMTAEEFLSTYGKKYSDVTEVKIVSLKYAKPGYVLAALDSLKSNLGKIVIDEDSGSVVIIDTPDNLVTILDSIQKIDKPRSSEVYQLMHAKAEDLAAQLKTRLDAKALGSVQADARSNQLLVTASQETIREVWKLIKKLDKPTKAVLLEVRILKILLNPKYDYGIEWSNPFGRSGSGTARDFNLGSTFPIATSVSSVGTLAALTYGLSDASLLQFKINALEQVIDTKTIATPRLMVTNNEEAQIHIGDTIPYVTSTTTGTGDTATVSEEINFIDVGIKLNVLPTINEDGTVLIKIRPEISSQTKTITTPQAAEIPQINTTFVETTILVHDGHTVILGGLKQLVNTNNNSGVPGLMDLPFFGKFFRNDSKSLEDTEIVIFLTPHVVKGNENMSLDKAKVESIKSDKEYLGL